MNNSDNRVDINNDNTNTFLTQGANTTHNDGSIESRSNASISDIPKLPQITSTATT